MKCISQARVAEQFAKACDKEELLFFTYKHSAQSTGLAQKHVWRGKVLSRNGTLAAFISSQNIPDSNHGPSRGLLSLQRLLLFFLHEISHIQMAPNNENKEISKHEVSALSSEILSQKRDSLLLIYKDLNCQEKKCYQSFSKSQVGKDKATDVTSEGFFNVCNTYRTQFRFKANEHSYERRWNNEGKCQSLQNKLKVTRYSKLEKQ